MPAVIGCMDVEIETVIEYCLGFMDGLLIHVLFVRREDSLQYCENSNDDCFIMRLFQKIGV